MIAQIRFYVSKLMPTSLKWRLIKVLPNFVNYTAKTLQGIAPYWEDDSKFTECYTEVYDRSLLDKKRAFILYSFARNCSNLEGAYAELGTYKGAGAKLINLGANNSKEIYLFDTFEGLPETTQESDPFWKKGDMNEADYVDVKNYLKDDCFKIIKGVFPDTTKEVPAKHFAFVHIDADVYESTVSGCEYFYSRMIQGGVILFDDYGFLSCPGVKKAVDDFFDNKPEKPIYIPSGQCFVIKQ